jgi:hypothetical protein
MVSFAQEDNSGYAGLGLGAGIPLSPFKSKTIDLSGGSCAKTGFSAYLFGGYQIPEKPYGVALSIGYNLNKFDINGFVGAAPTGTPNTYVAGSAGSYSTISIMIGPSVGDRADNITYDFSIQIVYVSADFPNITYSITNAGGPSGTSTYNYSIASSSAGKLGFRLAECVRYSLRNNLNIIGNMGVLYAKPTYTSTTTITPQGGTPETGTVTTSRYIFILNISVGVAYGF